MSHGSHDEDVRPEIGKHKIQMLSHEMLCDSMLFPFLKKRRNVWTHKVF